jgi:putative thiamine transport system substrate-binding protein
MLSRRHFVLSAAASFLPVVATKAEAADWSTILAEAKGQTVYFNAWAGSETINGYIEWVKAEMAKRYGMTVEHVKITDTSEVVKRVRDEVAAGKTDGSVDLVWINGENFRTMKSEKLLFGPFAESLPNFRYVDTQGKPTTLVDFQESVDGLESPWGMAQFTFFADGKKIKKPPQSMQELVAFAKANTGRVTYSAPPDFYGTTFLKQVLAETLTDPSILSKPTESAAFAAATSPAFALLDEMHQYFWRNGKQFPKDQASITQMVADGELLIGITFNPNEPANLVATKILPASTISWQHAKGTIGNTHFVAIPINAKAKAAAQVMADFLLSPTAQLRKADLKIWGDPTVLATSKLLPGDASLFKAAASAPGGVAKPAPTIPEPHASWVVLIEKTWLERYGAG